MRELITNIVPENLLRKAQLRAFKTYSDVIECTYGPRGGYTAYAKTNVDNKSMAVSYYSKDGLTVLKNVEVDQPIEALLKDELIDICTNVVKIIGDGTSSAVLLSYRIFEGMLYLVNERGYKKRDIIQAFKELVEEMSDRIKTRGNEATIDDIYNIALTSSNGDETIANMISDIYMEYGMDVWIEPQASSGPETVIKGYDGMVYDSGYLDPCFINNEENHTCELRDPHIYVFESPIDTPEMIKLFSMIIQKEVNEPLIKIQEYQKRNKPIPEGFALKDVLIICPFISRDANSYLDSIISAFTQTSVENRFHLCIVSDMNDDPAKLIDIMKLTGAKFIKKYIDPAQYEEDKKSGFAPTAKNINTFFGSAEKVIINNVSTRIINPSKMRDEDGKLTLFFVNYVAELKDILAKKEETRTDIVDIVKLKRRIHNILGNMVDLYIGGIGTSDRKSMADFIEDAILNCRSAVKEGVGYGASFDALIVANEMLKHYETLADDKDTFSSFVKLKAEMAAIIMSSYINIVAKLYEDYYPSHDKCIKSILESISTEENQERGPLNIITGEYDKSVLTSIQTEIAILESLSKIITIVFNTNQYLVPTPQFNCYTEKDSMTVTDPNINKNESDESTDYTELTNIERPIIPSYNFIPVKDESTDNQTLSVNSDSKFIKISDDLNEINERMVVKHVDEGPNFSSDLDPEHPRKKSDDIEKEPVEDDEPDIDPANVEIINTNNHKDIDITTITDKVNIIDDEED